MRVQVAHAKKLRRSKPSGQTLALDFHHGKVWYLDLTPMREFFPSGPFSRGLFALFKLFRRRTPQISRCRPMGSLRGVYLR